MIADRCPTSSIRAVEQQLRELCIEVFECSKRHALAPETARPVGLEIRFRHDSHMTTRRLVAFLRGTMCQWTSRSGGCVYCGFYKATNLGTRVTHSSFHAQLDSVYEAYQDSDADAVGLYNDGSFLNDQEIGFRTQLSLLKRIATWPRVRQVTIESRPEFITEKRLHLIQEALGSCSLEVAVGLDSIHQNVISCTTNKGTDVDSCLRQIDSLRRSGFRIVTLLTFKPPFLTEREALEDATATISRLLDLGIPVDIEAMTIQEGSVVELLHHLGMYRPPWLWTIVTLLKSLPRLDDVYLSPFTYSVHPSGVPHNCEDCSHSVAQQLLTTVECHRDAAYLPEIKECCGAEWRRDLDVQDNTALPMRASGGVAAIRKHLSSIKQLHDFRS